MRVIVLSHSSAVDNFGGAERSMVEFLEQWQNADRSIELYVISRSPSGHLQPELDRLGIPWMNLPFTSVVRHRRSTNPDEIYDSARLDFAAIRAIERFIVEFGADLVVTNTIVAPWAAIAAKLASVPHVWFVREFGDGHEFQIPREHVFSDIGTLSDLVVTNSEALRDYVAQWVEPGKISVLYPNLEQSANRSRTDAETTSWPLVDNGGSQRPLRLVCVGRITQAKGQSRIVRAVAQLRDEGILIDAVFVGSGSESDRRALEDLIVERDVSHHVVMTGELADPRGIVEHADIGVVASDSEGFGRVTVEYMAAGKPVVGAAVGATVELVEHGVTGRLFALDDEASLAAAIREYATDRTLIEKNGKAAQDHYREVILMRHGLPQLLRRLTEVSHSGSQPMSRLPNVVLAWLSLPEIVVEQLLTSGAMIDPKTSRTWRLGHAALVVPRKISRLVGRRGEKR